jgi:acyl-homoserine lactone acylase PvdQ
MQNCNIPPDAMMPDGPFSLAETRDYLFASMDYGRRRDGWTNQRGARAVELLSADDSVSAEEAIAYITDIQPYGASRWVETLRRAHEAHGGAFSQRLHYDEAIADLLDWDGSLAVGSTGALKYAYWRAGLDGALDGEPAGLAEEIDDWYAIIRGEEPEPLPDVVAESVAAVFADAIDLLVQNHGSLDATYGERFRVGRDDASWPLEGGGPNGTTTLRNIGYGPEREDHTRWGRSGQTSTQVVVLSQPPRSWIYIPLGQSDRPESLHYRDQAEELFSPRTLKPSWWLPEELADHIESRTELVREGGS